MISIVIRTFNEEKFLKNAMLAVSRQKIGVEMQIIIVDSGSTDDTLNIANRFADEIVSIKKEEFSFGRSLNLGCQHASGSILVFISAHCIPVGDDWLALLVAPMKDPTVALCYGRQVGNELSKFSEHQVFMKYFPPSESDEQGGFFCNNANSAIRRDLWLERPFDEDLTGLEDMDWAKFFLHKGFLIKYCPDAVIYHIHEETWKKVRVRYEREAYALKEIMPEVHFNVLDMLRSIIRGILNDLFVSFREGRFISSFKEIVFFRTCQFYGSYKGNHIHRKLSRKKKENYFYP